MSPRPLGSKGSLPRGLVLLRRRLRGRETWAGFLLFSLLVFFSPISLSAAEWAELGAADLSLRFREVDRSLARVLLSDLSRSRAEIATLLGVDPPSRVTVYLAHSSEDFADLTQGKLPHWGAGCAFPDRGLIVLRRLPGQGEALLRTARHEMAHILLRGARGLPVWFEEGVAMWAARQWRFRDSAEVFQALLRRGLIPLREMGSILGFSAAEAGLAYTESLLAVSYLIHLSGPDAIASVIAGVGSGDSFDQALYRTTGLTELEFERRFTEFAGKRFGPATLLLRPEALWISMALLTLVAYLTMWVRLRGKFHRPDEVDDTAGLPPGFRLSPEDREVGP